MKSQTHHRILHLSRLLLLELERKDLNHCWRHTLQDCPFFWVQLVTILAASTPNQFPRKQRETDDALGRTDPLLLLTFTSYGSLDAKFLWRTHGSKVSSCPHTCRGDQRQLWDHAQTTLQAEMAQAPALQMMLKQDIARFVGSGLASPPCRPSKVLGVHSSDQPTSCVVLC